MGINALLKSLLKPHAPEPEENPAGTAEAEPSAAEKGPLPEFNAEMPIDVMTDYSTILLSGKLSAFFRDELTIERIAGEMSFPIQESGTAVFVRCYDEQMEPFTMRAVITKSSFTECVLGSLELIHYESHRKSVRYPLSPAATIYAMEDTLLNKPQQCQLLNISTGGACISSSFSYTMGQILRLRVELIKDNGPTSYHCQVVRVSSRPDGAFEYGLLFAQLDKRKMNQLLRDIETIQAETKRRIMA